MQKLSQRCIRSRKERYGKIKEDRIGMKLAYVAGPYRAKTKLGIIINILRAQKVAKELWKAGYAVICPHMNSALMDTVAPEKNFLEGDIEILKHCDVLVVVKGWQHSSGTLNEIDFAHRNGIPVYSWDYENKSLKIDGMERVR
jgi:nucleoside 2-deoxyribosyltransferase